MKQEENKSGYSVYNKKYKDTVKINTLADLFPVLPATKFDVIYADPPWDYGGKCSMTGAV